MFNVIQMEQPLSPNLVKFGLKIDGNFDIFFDKFLNSAWQFE